MKIKKESTGGNIGLTVLNSKVELQQYLIMISCSAVLGNMKLKNLDSVN